jgi:2-polyprenyl-3-methyl-5-hydroxy-6-metoxy-1,4-benzoquinol methylase
MNNIALCPICDSPDQELFMNSIDYSVSKEAFSIVCCKSCGFHFTSPIPDEASIGSYYKSESYVSHSSSKKGVINRIYHWVRWYSLRRKVSLINSLSKEKSVLDIGAGTGHFLKQAKKAGWKVTGLEPDSDARNLAKSVNDVDLLDQQSLYSLENESFDVITMWHVLEHVYHLKKDVLRITELLKPEGTLVVAVPNMDSYDAKHYKEYWAAFDLPIHLYHFTQKDIISLFDRYSFELVETRPMIFDAFYVSMLSEKYRNGNMLKGVMTGLKSNWRAKEATYSSQIYILRKKLN